MLLVLGVIYFAVYYVIFRFMIVKFNLKTPGREDHIDVTYESSSSDKFVNQAEIILQAIGGKENVLSTDYCTTRLRLELEDPSIVDEALVKSTGAAGVVKPGGKSVQVIVGTEVQFVADEFKKLVK
ncbi:MAG: glucose PTS transporter subunit EIIB [Erysipelothrix sp.]